MRLRKHLIVFGMMVAMAGLAVPWVGVRSVQAQETVTITVSVTDFMRDILNDKLISDFESSHPGIKVNVVSSNQQIPFAANSSDKYFAALHDLVSSADVIYVDLGRLNSSLATQGGYFLDLAPLIAGDSSMKPSDFVPSLWQNYQWDQGTWALPMSATTFILAYDPAAFDKVNLPYPSGKWTMDDLAKAVRALGQKDADGKVTAAGLAAFPESTAYLFLSLLGDKLVDSSVLPNTPQIDNPALETIMDSWAKLDQEGWIGTDVNTAPMALVPAEFLMSQNIQDRKLAATLLPGGKAGLEVQGFAVSHGTEYPQQAYELAKFLTTRSELSMRFLGTPARQNPAPSSDGPQRPPLTIPPELQKLNETALANALTLSDLRYSDYVLTALDNMKKNGVKAKEALQTIQIDALKAQQAAVAQKTSLTVVVATPVPRPNANADEITLNFGLASFIVPMPNRDRWDQILSDFAASDPQVGKVTLNIGRGGGDAVSQNDCYYMPANNVPDADLSKLLNLDPLMSADPSFDKADFIGNVLAQVQRDNKTWALPIAIEPAVLRYDRDAFKRANIQAPESGWTMADFLDALRALKTDPQASAPFVPKGIGGTGQYLLMLIAANGGLPLDYRTTPPTINFTDPATIEAIQQVLDLAKQGEIKYSKLGNAPFKPVMFISLGGEQSNDAIYTDVINAISFQQANNPGPNPDAKPSDDGFTTYPRGTKYSALAYTMSTAYINAQAQNPEACYRLIKMLAAHPELFNAMPVRHSMINDPALKAAQGVDLTALYNQLDALLKDQNTVAFPSGFVGGGVARQVLEYWLFHAFDQYVLDGKSDLKALLTEAQSSANAFQGCMAANPPAPSNDGNIDNIDVFKTCAEKADPSLK